MNVLAALGALFGVEITIVIKRIRESAVAFAAIGVLVVIALGFLLVAAYNWLAPWLGPIWGPLAIAAAALVIALVFYIALMIQHKALAERERKLKRAHARTALLTKAAVDALPALMEAGLIKNVALPLGVLAALMVLSKSSRGDKE